jgi:hypothetical protein
MTILLPVKRATVLIPSGPASDPHRKHLHILLTDPQGPLKDVLLVGVNTVHPGLWHDAACILFAGDHEFLRHKSFVNYSRARIQPVKKIMAGVKEGLFEAREALSTTLFARVCRGIEVTTYVEPEILRFYENSRGA